MALMLTGTVLRGLFLMGSMVSVARVGQRTMLDLQNDVFRNVLDMETSELDVKGTGDLISRIRGETGAIGQAVMTLFGKTVREPLKMLGCITGAALVNWRLLLLSLLICPLAGYLMVRLGAGHQTGQQAGDGRLGQTAQSTLPGVEFHARRQSVQHGRP